MAEIFVGEVAIGVVPDLRDFNARVRRELFPDADKIGYEYGRKLGDGIRNAVRLSIQRINAELDKGFDVNVGADSSRARDEIDGLREEEKHRPIKIPVEPDRNSLRSLGAKLRSAVGGVFSGERLGSAGLAGAAGLGIFSGASSLLAFGAPAAAAGAGVAGFAAVALPEITKVTTALGKTGAAGQKAWQQLTPQQKDIGRSFKGVEAAFHNVQKTVAPAVDEIVSMGAGLAKDFLPTLAGMARTGSRVIGAFIRPLDVWIKSRSFDQMTGMFSRFAIVAGKIIGPWLVQLLKAFAQLFVQLLPPGVVIMKALLPLIVQLVQDLTPAIVIVAKIAGNVLKWLQAHKLLMPVLVATLAIIAIVVGASGLGGIIAATIVVGLAISYLSTHWRQIWADIKHWAQDAWNFITHGWGQYLFPGLTLIRLTVQFVRTHWREAWNDIRNAAKEAWNFIWHGWGSILIPGIIEIKAVIWLVRTYWRQVWDDIRNWSEDAWKFLTHGWGQILVPELTLIRLTIQVVRDHWRQAWNDIRDIASSVWNFLRNDVINPQIRLFGTILPNAIGTAVREISRVWGSLEGKFKGPVKFLVNTVYDDGIARLWNDVMSHIGGPTLPTFRLASGGKLPGFGGGDVLPALLEPGETVVSKESSQLPYMQAAFRAAGVPGYQTGGLIGGIGSFFGGLFHGATDAGRIALALMTGNSKAAENALAELIHTPATAELAQMMIGIPKAIIKQAVSHVAGLFDSGGQGGVPGSVSSYAGLAKQVLAMLGQPILDYTIVLKQMMTESGGNPFAVNKWDINWQEGHPSVGLMQVIAGTFDAYAGPFRNKGPFAYGVSENPLANIYAGMDYAVHAYGSAPGGWTGVLGQGHGYDQGGWWPSGTFGWNTSGRSELVLTQDQMSAMGGDGATYVAHFDGLTLQAYEASMRRAFRDMSIHDGSKQRTGRRM